MLLKKPIRSIKRTKQDSSGQFKFSFPSGTMGIFGIIFFFFRKTISETFAESIF